MSGEPDTSTPPAKRKRKKPPELTKALTVITNPLTRNPRLRAEAALAYVTAPENPTLEQLREDERFADVPLSTLQQWSAEDGWVAKRAGFFDSLATAARQRLASQMVQQLERSLSDLDEAQKIGMAWLADPEVKPRSWEGAAGAVVAVSKRREEIARSIGLQLLPAEARKAAEKGSLVAALEQPVESQGQSSEERLEASTMSEAELQAAAAEVLRLRRERAAKAAGVETRTPEEAALEEAAARRDPMKASVVHNRPITEGMLEMPREAVVPTIGLGDEDEEE